MKIFGSRKYLVATCIGLTLLVSLINYRAGYEWGFGLFYLIPIWIAAWYGDFITAVSMVVISSVCWFYVDTVTGHKYPDFLIHVERFSVRTVFFLIIPLLLTRLKAAHEREKLIARKDFLNIRSALDESSIVLLLDQEANIIYVNDKFCQVSGYSRGELLGVDYRRINSEHHSKDFVDDLWATVRKGNIWKGELKNKAQDNGFYWVDTTIVPFLNEQGKPDQFVAIQNDITSRKMMEQRLENLSLQIMQAQEDEQARISRDIHDDLGQSLIALQMNVQETFSQLKDLPEQDRQRLSVVIGDINQVIKKTRHIAYALRPSSYSVLGLTASIDALISDFIRKKKLVINAQLVNLNQVNFKGDAINLYRILQEVMTNIVKHAQATDVTLRMEIKDGKLHIMIKDNGRGFQIPVEEAFFPNGLGLSTMKERVKLLEGELRIESGIDQGTFIDITLPVSTKEKSYV